MRSKASCGYGFFLKILEKKFYLLSSWVCSLDFLCGHVCEGEMGFFFDRRYFTGDRVQRKLKWAFGTRSPFTEDSIMGLLYTVAVYGQRESLHRYPVIVYLSSATVWIHGSRLSTKFVEVSREFFFFILQNTQRK